MLTLKQLKTDIQFNRELGGLIEVLKGIASSHFRNVQARREYFKRFSNSLADLFKMVNLLKSKHPFLRHGPEPTAVSGDGSLNLPYAADKNCIMIITSDEGFLGDLNAQVINAGLSCRKKDDVLIVLGERGAHSLQDAGESFLYFPGIPEEIEHEEAYKLRDYLIQQYMRKKFGKVLIAYPKFISFSQQEVSLKHLLPYTLGVLEANPEEKKTSPEVLIEPSENSVIDYLIRIWMEQEIYNILWESKLSELARRVIHLEGSSQVISELNKKLQFFYFRTLHQLSDKNIREIVASRLVQ